MPFRLSVLLLSALLGLTQCMPGEGPEPATVLPEATQTGANTAGCRVNGAIWAARQDAMFIGEAISVHWLRSPLLAGKHQLSLYFLRSTNERDPLDRTSISFFLPDVDAPGTFVLNQSANPRFGSTNPAYGYLGYQLPNPGRELLTGPLATGRLVVTRLDTSSRVVSGTFEFTGREAATGPGSGQSTGQSTGQVTEGRFDCRF